MATMTYPTTTINDTARFCRSLTRRRSSVNRRIKQIGQVSTVIILRPQPAHRYDHERKVLGDAKRINVVRLWCANLMHRRYRS